MFIIDLSQQQIHSFLNTNMQQTQNIAVVDSDDALAPNLQSSESLSVVGDEEEFMATNSNNNNDKESKNTKKLQKSSVSFSTVRVHHHRLSLGDNPGVSS